MSGALLKLALDTFQQDFELLGPIRSLIGLKAIIIHMEVVSRIDHASPYDKRLKVINQQSSEQPPAKAGGFGLRLKAGSIGPSAITVIRR